MKLTNRQAADIESIRFFIPAQMKNIPITEQDIQQFLALSENGKGSNQGKFSTDSGFAALVQGKRWREWHMRSWEQTVLEGTIPYYTLLGGEDSASLPFTVKEYMKKSMFSGRDAVLIERVYNVIQRGE